jgi:hypothetical protein
LLLSAQLFALLAADLADEHKPTNTKASEERQHTYAKGGQVHAVLGGFLEIRDKTFEHIFIQFANITFCTPKIVFIYAPPYPKATDFAKNIIG